MKKKIIILISFVILIGIGVGGSRVLSGLQESVYLDQNFRRMDLIYNAIEKYKKENDGYYPASLELLIELDFVPREQTFFLSKNGEKPFEYLKLDDENLLISPVPDNDGLYLRMDREGFKGYTKKS